METKSVVASKINVTALVQVAVTVAVLLGAVPKDKEVEVLVAANTIGPALIMVWRTWFTNSRLTWGDE